MQRPFLALLASLALISGQAQAAVPSSQFPSLAPMLKKVMPAVVNIAVQGELPPFAVRSQDPKKGKQAQPEESPEGDTQDGRPRKFNSLGSGVIIDAEKGFIITNAHVVRDARTITVTLNDGRKLEAKPIGADPSTDVAVLQIKATHLQSIDMGDWQV